MSDLAKTEAICLMRRNWRETSCLVTCLTRDHGLVTLRAKGARRPRSKFGAGLEIATHSRIIYYRHKGRPLYTLSDVELLNSYPYLRGEPERLWAAAIALEFTARCLAPDAVHRHIFELLLDTLQALDTRAGHPEATAFAYLLQATSLLGYSPQLDHCVNCLRRRAAVFGPKSGGLLCARCLAREPGAIPVDRATLIRLRQLRRTSPAANLRLPLSSTVKEIVLRHLLFHFEGLRLKSLGANWSQGLPRASTGCASACASALTSARDSSITIS